MKVVKTVPAPRGELEYPAGQGAEGFFFLFSKFDLLFRDLRLPSLVLHQTCEISQGADPTPRSRSPTRRHTVNARGDDRLDFIHETPLFPVFTVGIL